MVSCSPGRRPTSSSEAPATTTVHSDYPTCSELTRILAELDAARF